VLIDKSRCGILKQATKCRIHSSLRSIQSYFAGSGCYFTSAGEEDPFLMDDVGPPMVWRGQDVEVE
jgi:hypothetical protein